MNLFEAVKQNVTTRQVAELYGIRVGRNGMAVCPFHNDKNPRHESQIWHGIYHNMPYYLNYDIHLHPTKFMQTLYHFLQSQYDATLNLLLNHSYCLSSHDNLSISLIIPYQKKKSTP